MGDPTFPPCLNVSEELADHVRASVVDRLGMRLSEDEWLDVRDAIYRAINAASVRTNRK